MNRIRVPSVRLLETIQGSPLLRQRKVWIAAGLAVALGVSLYFWTRGVLRRSEVQEQLQALGAFRGPALDVAFPRIVIESASSEKAPGEKAPGEKASARQLLEPGVSLGFWTLRSSLGSGGASPEVIPEVIEVRLTDAGRRLFSLVGNQILGTFTAGHREMTRLVEFRQTDTSRQVRFQYEWSDLHPAVAVLGAAAPELGREYEGEALLLKEGGGWRVLRWSTPEFDEAIARFRALEPWQGQTTGAGQSAVRR